MATRSLIGINLDNEITKIIYCHWDGYPSGVGQVLVENYNTPSSITDLMGLGDLSSLGETLDQCTAYHRDRKEPWGQVEPRDVNTNEIVSVGGDYNADYIYIYDENYEWKCLKYDGTQTNILAYKA
jgi:hypothetical protein